MAREASVLAAGKLVASIIAVDTMAEELVADILSEGLVADIMAERPVAGNLAWELSILAAEELDIMAMEPSMVAVIREENKLRHCSSWYGIGPVPT